jgi:hypothetical protein
VNGLAHLATAAKRWMWRGRFPPSGERWLRENGGCVLCSHPLPSGGCGEEDFHRLASGGYGGTVATGERWLRGNVAAVATYLA